MKLRQLVLVVEPSDKLAQPIRTGLRSKGFEVTLAKRGSDAIRAATALSSDVIIANQSLPDMSGAELRRAILQYEQVADLPLVLYRPEPAARSRHRFVLEPDLYASEPITLPRFCQRVAVLSRPRGGRTAPELCEAGTLKVDTVAHRVFVGGAEVVLTALEFRLLVMFMSSKERVLSREQLLRDVWGIRAHADTRTVDTNVKRLRQKLGPGAAAIETIRNVGYRFDDRALSGGVASYADNASAPTPSKISAASGDNPAGQAR
ncbi:MAG TPA: response regulator transcription factor [Polyangiaceae bacterium]|nr:response regulator transcription factor [Polyangiaceae bacterium]